MLIAKPIKLTKAERASIRAFTSERMMAFRETKPKVSQHHLSNLEAIIFNAIASAYFAGRRQATRSHKPKFSTRRKP